MSNPTDPKSGWQQGDSRLREFLRRASPILAAERGWNERSQLKIKSLADDLRLPADLYERAVERLKKGELDFEDQFSAYEQQFIKYVHRQLKHSKIRVLTASHETTAIRVARREYEIPQTRARQLVRQVAEQLGISRVSKLDAVEYVATLIDETIGDANVVSDSMRGRIFEAGKNWGVEPGQVEILIGNRLAANRQTLRLHHPWRIRVIAVVVSAVVMALLGWLVYSVVNETRGEEKSARRQPATPPPATGTASPSSRPDWWSPETRQAFDHFADDTRAARFPHDLLKSADAADRMLGYRNLVQRVTETNGGFREECCRIFAHFYRDETPELCDRMSTLIGELAEWPADHLPSNTRVWENVWRAHDLLAACGETTFDATRLQRLDEVSMQVSGVSIRQTDFRDRGPQSIARRQWQLLNSKCFTEPDQAARLMDDLGDLTRRELGHSVEAEHATVITLLNVRPGVWNRIRRTLQRVVEDANEDQLRELYVRKDALTGLPELQSWLGVMLARRLEIAVERLTASRIDEAIEKKLHLTPARSRVSAPRWRRLRDSDLYRKLAGEDLKANPQAISDAARLATVAFLIWHAEQTGNAEILETADVLLAENPRDLAIRSSFESDPASQPVYRRVQRRAVPSDQRALEDSLARLLGQVDSSPQANAIAFERLAAVASRFRDIPLDQAQALARYMLDVQDTSELVAIEKHLAQLRHWANLALALTDEILVDQGSIDQAMTCSSVLLGIQPEIRVADWRSALHDAMREQILRGLKHTSEIQGTDVRYQWHELKKSLAELYRIRCLALGVPAAEISAASTPAEFSELAMTAWGQRHGVAVDRGVTANRYLATNELHLTALHGRSLLELLTGPQDQTPASAAENLPAALLENELGLLKSLSGRVP